MTISEFLIYFFCAAAAIAALFICLSENIFHSVLGLLIILLSIAGIYGLLGAEFIAITQLVIYAGGIIILVLFGIMLTNKVHQEKALVVQNQHIIAGIILSSVLFLLMIYSLTQTKLGDYLVVSNTANSIQTIGIEMISTYAAPFELSGILLLVCLIGAAYTAASKKV